MHEVLAWAYELMQRKDIAVLDTETTGLNPDDVIVEIAIITIKGEVLIDQLVRPNKVISKAATAIHHIDYEMVRMAPGFDEVLPQIVEVLRAHPNIVSYNADFDMRMLLQSTSSIGAQWLMGERANDLYTVSRFEHKYATQGLRWLCLMQAYAEYWGEEGRYPGTMKWQRLSEACTQQGITWDERWHRALGDARATLALLTKLAELYEMNNETTKREAINVDA